MDPAAAALAGAAIGAGTTLLVGLVAPWVREDATRKRARRAELREEINTYVDALTKYLISVADGETPHSETMIRSIRVDAAANHVAMGLNRAEDPVAFMVRDTGDSKRPLKEQVARADACIDTLREWYRGEISTRAVSKRFEEHLELGLSEMTDWRA